MSPPSKIRRTSLLVVASLESISSLAGNKSVPWGVVGISVTLGLILILGGSRISHKEAEQETLLTSMANWLITAIVLLGVCLIARFVLVVFDSVGGRNVSNWLIEISLGLASIAVVIVGLKQLKLRAGQNRSGVI